MTRDSDHLVIYCSDGEAHIDNMNEDQIINRLNAKYWGDMPFLTSPQELSAVRGLMIIRGKIITPKPVKVVELWSLED